jgi:hypothetical protein
MTEPLAEAKTLFRSIRITLAVSGALALIAGIVLLVWPVKSAVIVTAVFASYLIVAGLVYIGLGIFSGARGGCSGCSTSSLASSPSRTWERPPLPWRSSW